MIATPRAALVDPRSIVVKARRPDVSAIEALARKLEPGIARAILQALQAQAASVDIEALAAALQTGDIGKVLALLHVESFDALMGTAQKELQGATWAAGAATAAQIVPNITGAVFRFNQLNPALINWLQTYSLGLIQQVNDQTREGVRQFLVAGMNSGESPITVARQVKQVIGLTERQTQAIANFRKELQTFHLRRSAGAWNLGAKIDRVNGRQVFKPDDDGTPKDGIDQRRLRDFRFDGQLRRALESGNPLTPEQIDKMVDAYARKYLQHRAQTIARTEALRATNAGVQDAWRQAIDGGKVSEELVRRQWVVAKDERLCRVCSPIPRLNPKKGVGLRQPFATPKGPVMLPPIHPNCRCTIFVRVFEPQQLSEAK